ncbi:MAG: HAD family hydrolase [Rubrivivax sp.]|nr:HAD family hydrolase [Rubrivivax sp.]
MSASAGRMPDGSPLRRPELVIFDCDGVLVDSERLSHEVLQAMLAEHGLSLTLAQTFERFMGSSSERCRDRVADLLGPAMPDDFMRRFGVRSVEAFAGSLLPVPGVAAVLDALASPFCVASNGPHEKMRFTLGHTGLLPRFEGRLFSADDVSRPKPAPDLFLHAAQTLGAAPQGCVVVEDSPTGVAAARAAGMTVFGYAAMGQGATLRAAGAAAVFDRMSELLPWVCGAAAG